MRNLSDINGWKQSFGLFPMNIFPTKGNDKFLMLNGGSGDFCLQTSISDEEQDLFFGYSWSTNTKNYVVLDNDNVHIWNWLDKKTEIIDRKRVEESVNKFYKYLSSKSYRTESDVVPFIIALFRQLRNVTSNRESPSDALNLLFKLLVSIQVDYTSIDNSLWGIGEVQIPNQFDHFVGLIKEGVKSITPNLDLILRHSSGTLFQEAHREVIYFNPQRDLFGGVSSKLITKSDAYSSVHYTPQYLARAIVEQSLKHVNMERETLKILDPACGSSEFLIESLKQLKNLGFKGKVKVVGWDTSESAVSTSKFLLQYEKRTQWDCTDLDFEIKLVNDSLTEAWGTDYDLILMNPPFVSWELLKNKGDRDAIKQALGSFFNEGKPNLASAFFYKAVTSLNSDGVIGCVLPSSIFTFDSYSKLRNAVKEELTLNIIAKLGNFVFEDALTDVSFFIGKKPKSDAIPKFLWCKNEKGAVSDVLRDLRKMESNNEQAIEERNYSIYTPPKFPILPDNWKVISLKENKLIEVIERRVQSGLLTRTSEIFTVQQGIRQGKKEVFKITKDEYSNILEKNLFRPVVDNKAIKNGQLFDSNYIWYPYDSKGMIYKVENDLLEIDFFKTKIKPHESELKERAGIQEWWGHTRPRNWQFEKHIKLVSTEFGKSDSFAIDIQGDFVVERGHAWIPKKSFILDDYYFYLSCFSSSIFDSLLSIYSKPIISGYYLGKIYTKDIPIPDIHTEKVKESDGYRKLVEFGRELELGNTYVKQVIDEVLNIYFYPRS